MPAARWHDGQIRDGGMRGCQQRMGNDRVCRWAGAEHASCVIVRDAAVRRAKCRASFRLLSRCSLVCASRSKSPRAKSSRSLRRPRERPAQAWRPSTAYRTVPPIPGRLPIRAASATPRACRRSAPIHLQSQSPRRLWRRHALPRRLPPIQTAHSGLAPTPSNGKARHAIAGPANGRSVRSRGSAGGVNRLKPLPRRLRRRAAAIARL
jgi:hypothetical protein